MGNLAYSHANAYLTSFLTNSFLPFSSPGDSNSSWAISPLFSMSLSSSESSLASAWSRCLWVTRVGSTSDGSSPSSDSSAAYSKEISKGTRPNEAESGNGHAYNVALPRSRHYMFSKMIQEAGQSSSRIVSLVGRAPGEMRQPRHACLRYEVGLTALTVDKARQAMLVCP